MTKFFKGLFGYYRLFVCKDCHAYSKKYQLNKGVCPVCNGEVKKYG